MSDDLKLTDTFRKIFLAGVGAVALGAEKSKAAIDSLVEKGELTVEQGKVLNQELKHKIVDAAADAACGQTGRCRHGFLCPHDAAAGYRHDGLPGGREPASLWGRK